MHRCFQGCTGAISRFVDCIVEVLLFAERSTESPSIAASSLQPRADESISLEVGRECEKDPFCL
jgi:hypothetical protein